MTFPLKSTLPFAVASWLSAGSTTYAFQTNIVKTPFALLHRQPYHKARTTVMCDQSRHDNDNTCDQQTVKERGRRKFLKQFLSTTAVATGSLMSAPLVFAEDDEVDDDISKIIENEYKSSAVAEKVEAVTNVQPSAVIEKVEAIIQEEPPTNTEKAETIAKDEPLATIEKVESASNEETTTNDAIITETTEETVTKDNSDKKTTKVEEELKTTIEQIEKVEQQVETIIKDEKELDAEIIQEEADEKKSIQDEKDLIQELEKEINIIEQSESSTTPEEVQKEQEKIKVETDALIQEEEKIKSETEEMITKIETLESEVASLDKVEGATKTTTTNVEETTTTMMTDAAEAKKEDDTPKTTTSEAFVEKLKERVEQKEDLITRLKRQSEKDIDPKTGKFKSMSAKEYKDRVKSTDIDFLQFLKETVANEEEWERDLEAFEGFLVKEVNEAVKELEVLEDEVKKDLTPSAVGGMIEKVEGVAEGVVEGLIEKAEATAEEEVEELKRLAGGLIGQLRSIF